MYYSLWINDGGFNTSEIEAGVRAAEAVLESAQVTADLAQIASQAEADGVEFDMWAAAAWQAAEAAAIEAASAGWARAPEGAVLVLS